MGRPLVGRVRLRGWLRLRTPLHVGGLSTDPDVDLPLAYDGLGRPYVPGTGLAGPIRAWCARDGDEAALVALWGSADEKTGRASRVLVDDGLVLARIPPGYSDDDPRAGAGEAPVVEQRDGVGIDRVSGVAAPTILHRADVLPRGAVVRFRLDVESASARQFDADIVMVAAIASALVDGLVRFGGSKTRGLGRVELDRSTVSCRVERVDSPAGMLDALEGKGELDWDALQALGGSGAVDLVRARAGEIAEVTVSWKAAGPLMVRAGLDGMVVDAVPLMSALEPSKLVPVLPGSSVKGALRARAELVLRTLLATPAPRARDPRRRFLDQLADLPLVTALFGGAHVKRPDGESDGAPASGDTGTGPLPGLGALSVDDCYAGPEAGVSPEAWRAVFTEKALPDLGTMRRADHVAIDRWTGGAADHLLFNVLEPQTVAWEPLRLQVDLARLGDLQGPAVALLLLVLRDFEHGLVPLGFATNRGMGSVTVENVEHPWAGNLGPLEDEWRQWLATESAA